MKLKILRNALLIAVVPLFIAGCGDKVAEINMNTLPNILKVKQSSKTYIITGIGLKGTNKVAIINGQVVTPGMELDPGVVLKDVQSTYAVIVHGNTEHRIRPEGIQSELDQKRH